MNRLSFRAFHETHFNQEQAEYFKQLVKNSQYSYNTCANPDYEQADYVQTDYEQTDYEHTNYDQTDYEHTNYEQTDYNHDYAEYEQHQNDAIYSEDLIEHHGLSKEAVEIFRFSEAYRQERESERIKEAEEEEAGTTEWQFGESSVKHHKGIEAPSNVLVLTQSNPPLSEEIRIHEDLLNSAYLSSCNEQDGSVVFWPILPLRL